MADNWMDAIINALGMGQKPAPPPPQINEAQPWMTGYQGLKAPTAMEGGAPPQEEMAGNNSLAEIDALLAQIKKQKQVAAAMGGGVVPQ